MLVFYHFKVGNAICEAQHYSKQPIASVRPCSTYASLNRFISDFITIYNMIALIHKSGSPNKRYTNTNYTI